MYRKSVWKNTVSDAVSWHQDQALNTTIFILKEYGPTGFLLKVEGESKHFKVCLGDPHSCTCSTFIKDRDLCKHICWVLMRKFRLPREHEYCFQQGLVERQILEVLQGLHKSRTPRLADTSSSEHQRSDPNQEDGGLRQKRIQAQDVCPICQEELMKKRLPVCYCRFGCGNNVHISCMKVWADHQLWSEGKTMMKCPLCREDFGSLKLLQEQVKNTAKLHTAAERQSPDKHLGILCNNCRIFPISGTCFKCTVCCYYHLCEDCMSRNCHAQHSFAMRTKRTQKWRPMKETACHSWGEPQETTQPSVNDSAVLVEADAMPEHVIKTLPVVRVGRSSRLLEPGLQCRMCLGGFLLGQNVRTLPCHHKFHTDCVDGLLRRSNACPLDGSVIFNPLLCDRNGRTSAAKPASSPTHTQTKLTVPPRLELFVPGVSLLHKAGSRLLPPLIAASSEGLAGARVPTPPDSVSMGFQGLCIDTVNTESTGRLRETEGKRALPKTLVRRKSYSFDQLRRVSSRVRLNTNSGSCHQRTMQHVAISSDRSAACEGSGGSQQGLFVGLHLTITDRTEASPHNTAIVPQGSCPWVKLRARPRPKAEPLDRLTAGLRLTGAPISAPQQGGIE